jgi:hypothetical protein
MVMSFDVAKTNLELSEMKRIQRDILNFQNEFYDFLPGHHQEFLDILKNEELYDKIRLIFSGGFNVTQRTDAFKNLLLELPKKVSEEPLMDLEYRLFSHRLMADTNIELMLREKYQSNNIQEAYSCINSLFLERYLLPDQKLRVSHLPPLLEPRFGAFLSKGEIEIDQVGDDSFYGMSGGKVHVKRAYSGIAKRMLGGFLEIDQMQAGIVGQDALGGSIAIQRNEAFVGSPIARSLTVYIGVHIGPSSLYGSQYGMLFINRAAFDFNCENGLALSNELDNKHTQQNVGAFDLVPGRYLGWRYDQRQDKYIPNPQGDRIPKFDNNLKSYDGTFDADREYVNYNTHFTVFHGASPHIMRVNGGISVFKKVGSNHSIGRLMDGGIIIVDDPKISLEEARKRVCADRKGGFVFYLQHTKEKGNFGLTKKGAKFIKIG